MERRKRRTQVELAAERLAGDIATRLGRDIRESRFARGWTQAQLAARARLTRPVLGRIERCEVDPTLRQLGQIAAALGRPLSVTMGRDPAALPADAGHLAVQELVIGLGRGNGDETRFELSIRPSNPWLSADVVLSRRAARVVIVAECWNVIGDVGAAARSSTRKRQEAADLALAAWGPAVTAHLVWVVRNTRRNRVLVATYPGVFAARFPGSSRAWVDAITTGSRPPVGDGLVWADPGSSRLFAWRKQSSEPTGR